MLLTANSYQPEKKRERFLMKVACLNATGECPDPPMRIAGITEWREKLCSSAGFTLVELIMVTAILGVLVMLTIPSYNHFVSKVKITRAITEIRGLEKDILASTVDKNTLPNSLNDVGRGSLLDPWGNPYQFLNFANPGIPRQNSLTFDLNTDFDLYSLGPDGLTNTDVSAGNGMDDLVRAGNGGWVGIGKDF